MKRLNLKNGFLRRMMKRNMFARVVSLVVMMCILLPLRVHCVENWTYNGTTYYAIYKYDESFNVTYKFLQGDVGDGNSFDIKMPSGKTSTLHFSIRSQYAYNSFTATMTLSGNGTTANCSVTSKIKDASYQTEVTKAVHQGCNNLYTTFPLTGNTQLKYMYVNIPLPTHIEAENQTIPNAQVIGTSGFFNVSINSFLTTVADGNIYIEQVDEAGTNKSDFVITKNVITPGANKCGIQGGSGDFLNTNSDTYKFTIRFTPKGEGQRKAKFRIYTSTDATYGVNEAYIYVFGNGTKQILAFDDTEIDESSDPKDFTMSNFIPATCSSTSNVAVTAPTHFYVSTDITNESNWVKTINLTGCNGKFWVKFKPNDANPALKENNLTITACDNESYYVGLTGTAKKIPLAVSWKENGAFVMEIDEYRSDFLNNSESESLDLQPIFTLANQTYVEYLTGSSQGVLHAHTATPSGTTVGLSVAFPSTITERYAITGPTSGATIQVTPLQRKFIKWDVSLEYLRYESGNTQHTSADITLDAIVVDKDGVAIQGQTITYTLTNVTGTPVQIVGNKLKVIGIGEAKLTINSPGNSTYFEAESERRIVVSQYRADCIGQGMAIDYRTSWKKSIHNESSTTIPVKVKNGETVPITNATLKYRLSGTLGSASAEITVQVNDGNGQQIATTGQLTGTVNWTELPITIPPAYRNNLTGLYLHVTKRGSADLSNVTEVCPVTALQASYFEKADNSITAIPFGQCEVDKTSKKNVTVKFSALHESIHAVITGTDAAYFTVEEYTSTNGCADFGTKTIEVKFKPMSVGHNYSATLHLYGYTDASETVPVDLSYSLSGSGTKRQEEIVWDENSQKLTDEYDNRGTLIELIAAPNVSKLDEETDWDEMHYSSDDTDVATVAKASDGKWYLTMVNAGTANIKAWHNGGSCTLGADKTLTFTVTQSTPDLTITAANPTPDVFSTTGITAESQKSKGTITLDVISTYGQGSKNGTIQTTSQTDGKSIGTLTIVTRANSESGKEGDIVVQASMTETRNYEACITTYAVKAQKVTPTIVWPNNSTELSGTHKVGNVVQLSAYIAGTTALKVEYTSSNTSLATVDNTTGKMTCKAAGVVKITAKQTTGNCDYASTTQTISYLFVISPAGFGDVDVLSNKTVPFVISTGESGTFSISSTTKGQFYFSTSQTTGWVDKSLTNIADGSTVYIKFQPHSTGSISKSFSVGHNSKSYNGSLSGTGKSYTKDFGNRNIVTGSTYTTWLPSPANFFHSTSDTYSISLSGDDQFLIHKKNGGALARQFSNLAATNGSRVGYFPKKTQQCTVTVTITDNHFGVSYTFTVKGTGVMDSHDFGSVEVGKGSAAHKIEMSYFDASSNLTVTAPNNHFLLSANGTSDWKTSLNLTTARATFYVHYAPEVSNVTQHSGYIEIHDNSSNSTENYKYQVTGTPTKSEIAFPDCEIDGNQTPLPFTMTNFICEGNVEVTPPANFVISSSENGPFQSTKLTIGAKGTFYVKLASTATINNYTGDVTMVDKKTGHTYSVSLKSKVTLKHSTISTSTSRIYLFPGDVNVHEMVGDGYIVHGSPKEMEPYITLSVPTDKAQYLEVKDDHKLKLKTGFTLTDNEDVTVTAAFAGNTRCAAAESKTFTARIVYTTNMDNREWVKEDNKWYVFKYTDLDLCYLTALVYSGEYNYNINIYLPNVPCNSQYFAVRNGFGWTQVADCPFSTKLFCNDQPGEIAYLSGVTTRDYATEGNHTTINLPARGNDAQLYTYTNRYDNPDCGDKLGNVHMKHAKIEIEVPRHYHKMKNSESVDFGNVQVGEVAYKDVKLNGTNGLFKSFLTTNGLTIAPVSGCPAEFFVNPDNGSQSMTLVPANEVLSPYNKIESFTGLIVDNADNYYIRIYFKPLVANQQYDGSFVLSDNDMSLTITVTGKGLVTASEPQYIVWDQDLSRLVGSGNVTLTAASNSGLAVSYAGGASGISVSGSNLSYSGNGTATITASRAGGDNNGVTYSAATAVPKVVNVYPSTPSPGTCDPASIDNPRAWRKNDVESPYAMSATRGFTWDGVGTAYQMTFSISLTNCTTATVTIYVNGTGTSNVVGTYTAAGDYTIDLRSHNVTSGSVFYCTFNGQSVTGEDGSTISFAITNIKIYYTSGIQVLTSSADFGTQRVGQVGITRNIRAIAYGAMNGDISASITGTDADCFTLITDKNPAIFNANCEEGVASYDVRFIPKKTGSLSANLHIVDPITGTPVDITLTGNGVKRDLKVKWAYADGDPKEIDAVGSALKTTLTLDASTQNAFAYDKLRGETAKTSLKVNYSVVNGKVDLLDQSKTDIVNVTKDANGKITQIQATGYGSGTVYIIASIPSFSPDNALFNAISTDEDKCTLTVVVRKVDADIALSVGSPFSLVDLHYGDKVEITGVTTTYDGVTLKKVDGTTPMYSVSELNLTATRCSIPAGTQYLCLTNVSSTTNEVYVTAAVSGNAIVKPISSKKISFTVGRTDQAIATKDFSVLRTRTASDTYRNLPDYFFAYDKRHSPTSSGGDGIPTYKSTTTSFNSKNYCKSVTLSLSNFTLNETGKESSCNSCKLAELEYNGSTPAVKKYSLTSGTVNVAISANSCGNSNYNNISSAVTKSYSVRKHSPNIEFIVGGTTASRVADKNNIVTVDVTYGETVSLDAHSYNIASGKTTNFYDSNDDGGKSFTFTSSNTNVGTISTNSFTALNVGTTNITVTQTSNCKITTYSNLAGDATGVSADDTPNPNKWYRIQVVPATRTIAWPNKTTYTNLTSASPDITLDAYTEDKNGNPIVPGAAGTVTYSIESADVITGTSPALTCVQLSSDNKTLIINGSGTATIKVSFAKSNYAAVYDTWTINIADESPALNVTPSSGISITSTDDNVDMLKYFTITNYSGETIVKSVSQPSGKTDVLTINGSTLKAFKEDASVQVPCTVEVTSRYLSDGSHPKAIGNISFAITKGTLVFNVAGGGKWIDNTKWSRPDIVQAHTSDNDVNLSDYNVSVIQSCHIGTGPSTAAGDEAEWLTHRVNASCHNLTIDGDNAKLVIGEASTLRVVGVLNNTNASKLVLAANNWGQASVVFGSGTPMATVEMYLPAGNGNRIDPRWHYRGIAVTKESFEPITEVPSIYDASVIVYPWSKVHIYRWYEEQNKDLTNGCWDSGMSGSSVISGSLEPWAGYAFANMTTDPVWLSYKGTLINANETVALDYNYYTYTDNNQQKPFANVGVNLITNSYAAPLLISQMGFSGTETYQKGDGSLEAGVVLYNSGSYGEWETAHSGSGGGNAGAFRGSAGQHSTVPKNTTEAVDITMIPSGQAFFVTAKETGATLTLTYGNDYFANSPNTRMYLPGQNEEPEFNILKIDVVAKSDSAADQLIMLECDSCSRQYDNGYDGIKRFGDSGLPQLYAYNKYGITAVNADSTFNKQYVGFAAGSDDETYTISFETDRLFGYHSLYLVDRKMNESVDILAGETYSFKGYTVGENTRFQINGMTVEEWEKENEGGDNDVDDVCDLRVVGNTLFVEGFTAEKYPAARVEVFDMTGNMVWSTELTDSRVYDLPSLPHGVYAIRLGDCHVKYGVR